MNSRLCWGLLVIAILGDFIVAYILAAFYPSYSHTKQVMSVLGNPISLVSTIYNTWLVILGLIFIFCAINFYNVFSPVSKRLAWTGFILY